MQGRGSVKLPPALLAKLQRRGILNDGGTKGKVNINTQLNSIYRILFAIVVQEEIIIENHDEECNPETYEYQSSKRGDDNVWTEKLKRRFKETTLGVTGCPNK